MRLLFLLFLNIALVAADFDCILIGSSPFSLFEALYQANCGQKVLILENSSVCGGAWKTIDMCGVPRVDLGCHMIGKDMRLKNFLEVYAGCNLVSLDHPSEPYEKKGGHGYYFASGCRELIDHLTDLAHASGIQILTSHKAESVSIDAEAKIATVRTKTEVFTTKKLILTPMSSIVFDQSTAPQKFTPSKHYHLYLLIQDPSPPKFSYKNGGIAGVSRMMNLTHFTEVLNTGRQLVVIQTHGEKGLSDPQSYIDTLKKLQLLDESAYLLRSEVFIYEAGKLNSTLIAQLKAEEIVEVLQTGTFQSLTNYTERWKQALKPYHEIFPIAN